MRPDPFYTLVFFCIFISTIYSQENRTFYIGHSLSDQIPDMVQSLSNDDPETNFSWVYQSIPGAPLSWQWDDKNKQQYDPIPPNYYAFYDQDEGLPTGDFDIMVLTESVPRYWEIIDDTYAHADSFFNYALSFNPNTIVYLYEDWHCLDSGTPTGCDYDVDSNPWRQRLTDDLPMWESVVDTLNNRYNPINPVCLIPGGQGLAALYDSIQVGSIPGINSIDDLFSDKIHLNDIGKYFIACIHFATIHSKSPEGLTNQLQVWWGGDFDQPSEELALKFQQIAWETAINYPNTCVKDITATTGFAESEIQVYPNPFGDNIYIESIDKNISVKLFDQLGREVLSIENLSNANSIDVSSLSKGFYFLQVMNEQNGQIETLQLVK